MNPSEDAELLPDLVPPKRFCMVQPGLYRGAYPTLRSLNFLRRLNLKTIISLIPKDPTKDLAVFVEGENAKRRAGARGGDNEKEKVIKGEGEEESTDLLQHIVLGVDKFKGDSVTLGSKDAVKGLELVLDPRNHPIFVHCLDGRHVTNHFCALVRRLQLWPMPAIIAEMNRFDRGADLTTKDEEAFLHEFSETLTLPKKSLSMTESNVAPPVPNWLAHSIVFDAEGNISQSKKQHGSGMRFKQAQNEGSVHATSAGKQHVQASGVGIQSDGLLSTPTAKRGSTFPSVASQHERDPAVGKEEHSEVVEEAVTNDPTRFVTLDTVPTVPADRVTSSIQLFALNMPRKLRSSGFQFDRPKRHVFTLNSDGQQRRHSCNSKVSRQDVERALVESKKRLQQQHGK